MSNDDEGYTVERLRRDVPKLAQKELARLVERYPTYRIKNFRMAYVEALKDKDRNPDNYSITKNVVAAKDIDYGEIRQTTSEGGELSKTGKKLKRAAIRLLFLRYKEDRQFKAAQARAYVRNNHFPKLSLRTIQDHTQDKSKKLLVDK